MQADQDTKVHMRLDSQMVKLLVNLNPKLYRQFVQDNRNRKPVLYVELWKTLYGILCAALLFW